MSEWRWTFRWTVLVLALTSIPYLIGWLTAIRMGQTFAGFVVGVVDGNSYLAKMRYGAHGNWLFQSVYTSEPHEGAFVYIFYLLLGKVAALLPGDPLRFPLRSIWVFHIARVLFSALLLRSIYRFLAYLAEEILLRRVTWIMIVCGGGLGWLLVAVGRSDWLGSMPLDFILPEGSVFLTILTLPHIALARTFLLEGFLHWLRFAESGGPMPWTAGVLWLGMAMLVPFYPAVVALVLLGTLVLRLLVEGGTHSAVSSTRLLRGTALAGSFPGVIVVYTAWAFSANPVLRGWAQQNLILSPHPLHYLLAYGIPGLFALVGAILVIRRTRPRLSDWRWLLVLAWTVVIPPFLYAPFSLQRRMIESYQVPLYSLAALALVQVIWPKLTRLLVRPRFVLALGGAVLAGSPLILVSGASASVVSGIEPLFHSREQISVAEWLSANASFDDIVLCEESVGNFLPAWAPVRTFLGHGSETVDVAEKRALVARFFDTENDGWRQSVLQLHRIRFVLSGPPAGSRGSVDLGEESFLSPVFSVGQWNLYEVVQ
jgi:hypothetical protein